MNITLAPMITDERLRIAQQAGQVSHVAAPDAAGAGPAAISIVRKAGYNGTTTTEVKAGPAAAVVAPAVVAPAPPAEPEHEAQSKKRSHHAPDASE